MPLPGIETPGLPTLSQSLQRLGYHQSVYLIRTTTKAHTITSGFQSKTWHMKFQKTNRNVQTSSLATSAANKQLIPGSRDLQKLTVVRLFNIPSSFQQTRNFIMYKLSQYALLGITNPVHIYLNNVFKFLPIPDVLLTGIKKKKTIKLCLRIFQCEHFCWHDKYPDDT